MAEAMNILLVADSPDHVERIRHLLEAAPSRSRVTVAETLAAARTLLADGTPDLLLVDYLLPDGGGMELLPENPDQLRWPVVLLIDSGDEHLAVEAIKNGALDYVVKNAEMLADLPYIVERSRREWGVIVEHRRVRRKAADFGRLLDASLNEIYTFDAETLHFIQVNRGARNNLGYSMAELRNLTPVDLKEEFTRESFEALLQPLRSGAQETISFQSNHRRKDGSSYPVEIHLQLLTLEERPVFVAMLLDISDRKRAEEALKRSEERFRSIFETAAAGIVMLAPDGRIRQVNPGFIRFIGYEEAELLGMSALDITHPDDRETTEEYYRFLFQNPSQIVNTEKRYVCKDGTVLWGYSSVACVRGGENGAGYCVGLVQDITQRKQMEVQLQEANRELDAFICTVSHDLRTPLTPIIGYAQYLKSAYADQLDAQALDLLSEIDRQGQGMAAMIADLLNLAKNGALKPPAEPVDVAQVIRELLNAMAGQIEEAGVAVQAGDLPQVRLPRTLLNQIFDNLIGNAIRYAGHAGGSVEVGGWREKNRVRLFVRDHGPGIPDTEKERIFEAFFRGTSGNGRHGTGIGLATIKRIARLYDGRAWVEDTPGGGATFWVDVVG